MVATNNDLPHHTFDTLDSFMDNMVLVGDTIENSDGSFEAIAIIKGDPQICLELVISMIPALEEKIKENEF